MTTVSYSFNLSLFFGMQIKCVRHVDHVWQYSYISLHFLVVGLFNVCHHIKVRKKYHQCHSISQLKPKEEPWISTIMV